MKTTTRISFLFVCFGALVIVIFWWLLNFLFLTQWYNTEKRVLNREIVNIKNSKWSWESRLLAQESLWQRFTKVISVDKHDTIIKKALQTEHRIIENLLHVWEERLLYEEHDNKIILSRVTPFMERQLALFKITSVWWIIFLLIWYFLSKRFAQYALRDLDRLSKHVHWISIWSLTSTINFPHLPDGDKIKNVSLALNNMQSVIHNEFQRIKRFVSNVSHEFKTPFMVMQSWSELALASWEHKHGLEQNIIQIKRLDLLLDTLTLLTYTQKDETLPKSNIGLAQMVHTLLKESGSQYNNKNQSVIVQIDKNLRLNINVPSLEIALKNLIDNAFKYTPTWGEIIISENEWTISIQNTWVNIPNEQIEHIREPFWQADISKERDKWFGLWLALVKEVCKKNKREIYVNSNNNLTTFSIQL